MNPSDRQEVVKILKDVLDKAYMYAQEHSPRSVYAGKPDILDVIDAIDAIETEPEKPMPEENLIPLGKAQEQIEYYKEVIETLEDKLYQTSMELERWKKGARELAERLKVFICHCDAIERRRPSADLEYEISSNVHLSVDELFKEE